MDKTMYGNLKLPIEVIEEFKDWAAAYRLTYGRDLSYAEVLRQMFASIEEGDPAVHDCYWAAMDRRERMKEEKKEA